MFFAASPMQLGLTDEYGFSKSKPYMPTRTDSVGFSNNAEARNFFMTNLEKSTAEFDLIFQQQSEYHKANLTNFSEIDLMKLQAGILSDRLDTCGYPSPPCVELRPRIICQAHGVLKVVDGIGYDRREPTCCEPWTYASGQVFTVVGFNKHKGYPVGQHEPDIDQLPDFLPGHIGWWLSYDEHQRPVYDTYHEPSIDGRPLQLSADELRHHYVPRAQEEELSHWGISVYNHDIDGSLTNPKSMTGYQKVWFDIKVNSNMLSLYNICQ